MKDRFGCDLELGQLVVCRLPSSICYGRGVVVGFVDRLYQISREPSRYKNRAVIKIFEPVEQMRIRETDQIAREGNHIVVLNDNDPRVTRFILENSVS